MKNRLSTILLVIIFCVGLFLLLYPTVSDYWNSMHQSRMISGYAEAVVQIDDDRYAEIWSSAHAYNQALAEQGNTWVLTGEQREDYHSQLEVAGGVISYIEIPSIDCALPMYDGSGYVYDVEATPKVEVEKEPETEEPTTTKPPQIPEKLPQTGQNNWPIPVLCCGRKKTGRSN